MANRSHVLLGGACTLIALGGTAAGFAATDPTPSGDRGPAQARTAGETQRTSVGPDRAGQSAAAAHLASLRRARAESDLIPPSLSGSPLLADGVADVPSARHADVGNPREDAWIVPSGHDRVCLVVVGTLTCPDARYIASRGVAPSLAWRGQDFFVAGIAVDGIPDVEVELADGRTAVARVSSNAFELHTTTPPLRVRWNGPDGAGTFAFDTSRFDG
jgi:hypothetical protein